MNSTYFQWKWVIGERITAASTEEFSNRAECIADAAQGHRDDAEMIITGFNANTNRPLLEKKVYGSFDLGHGIKLQAVEYNGKPHIDWRVVLYVPKKLIVDQNRVSNMWEYTQMSM